MRVLPPSGVPITLLDILAGLRGMVQGAPAVDRFRDEVCRCFGVRHCFFSCSGRAALSLLLDAFHKLRPKCDQVALPAYTSFSVPSAVVNAGLKVSLYDLDRDTLSADPQSLRQALTDRTLCVVGCHLYGYPADLDAVREVAAQRGVPVIDDAAQAMGATLKGRYAGTLGDAGLFSLSRGKNISTVDGGIIVTDSDRLAELLHGRELPTPGLPGALALVAKAVILSVLLRPRLYWIPAGMPFLNLGMAVYDPVFPLGAYTPFQAAIGSRMLGRLHQINDRRIRKANAIMDAIENTGKGRREGGVNPSDQVPKGVTPLPGATPVFLRLPRFGGNRRPTPEGRLGIVRSYPCALNEIEALRPHLVNDREFPGAKFLADSLVTAPTHEFVTERDVERIAATLQGRSDCTRLQVCC